MGQECAISPADRVTLPRCQLHHIDSLESVDVGVGDTARAVRPCSALMKLAEDAPQLLAAVGESGCVEKGLRSHPRLPFHRLKMLQHRSTLFFSIHLELEGRELDERDR